MKIKFFLALTLLASYASADSFSNVTYSLGPVPGVSPSYAAYTANAQQGVLTGSNVGCNNTPSGCLPTSPASFIQINSVAPNQFTFDTDFNNWEGSANPTGAYAGEYGTVLFFNVVLTGVGNDLSLSNLTYVQSDTDTLYPDYFQYSGTFLNSNYSADATGVLANGTTVAPGTAGTTLVHQIVLTGVGVGFDITGQYIGSPALQLFYALNDETSLGVYQINTCFNDTADGLSSCGGVMVTNPEPASVLLLGAGFGALSLAAYRRRRES